MKNKELYDKTIDILVDGYFNDTLFISSCGCGVGNIVARSIDVKIVKMGENGCWVKGEKQVKPRWDKVFNSSLIKPNLFNFFKRGSRHILEPENYEGEAKRQIDATGYTPDELMQLEIAFTKGYNKGRFNKDRMFTALMSMVSKLDDIHENHDKYVTKQTKTRFLKQLI